VTRPPNLNPETLSAGERERLAARLLAAWVSDTGFVIDRLNQLNGSPSSRFNGRLDIQKIGVVGHSMGGATAAQVCCEDARCRTGIDMDGRLFGSVIERGLQQPFMFVGSDHGDTRDPVDLRIAAEIQSVYDRLPVDGRLKLSIRGANHFSFADHLLLS